MGFAIDTDWDKEKAPESSVYTTGGHKCERPQKIIDGEHGFKAALRELRDICKSLDFDFEDIVATLASQVERER